MPFSAPSATNVRLPASIAQELSIGFGRRPDKFSLNRWTQRKNIDKIRDYYLRIRAEDAGRVRYADMRDKLWPSRTRRPRRPDNTPFYEWVPYETQRYSEGYEIDHREQSQADFDLSKHHASMALQQVMTSVTQLCATALEGATWTGNTATVQDLVGDEAAYLNTGTAEDPTFFKALLHAAEIIEKRTYGLIRPDDDLILLMSPTSARKLAPTEEFFAIRKESQHALPLITGAPAQATRYGLPPQIFGYEVVIENAVKTATEVDEDEAPEYILGDDIYLISRPEGLMGGEGMTAHSTLTIFQLTGGERDKDFPADGPSDFTIEENPLPFDRMTEGAITWEIDPQVTTTRSAFRFTNCFEPASSSSSA